MHTNTTTSDSIPCADKNIVDAAGLAKAHQYITYAKAFLTPPPRCTHAFCGPLPMHAYKYVALPTPLQNFIKSSHLSIYETFILPKDSIYWLQGKIL